MATLVLVDLSSILHREFAIHQQDGDVNATAREVVDKVRRIAIGQLHVAICCDSGRSFRKDISPSYKAQRAERDPSLYHQQALAIEKLKADGFPIWSVKEYEADDLIATATRLAMADVDEDGLPLRSVLIVTSDKDMYALISPFVEIKRTDTGVMVDEDACVTKLGVRPGQVRDLLCLWGDTSDNIVGAHGIGDKTAADYLARFGTIDDLRADIVNAIGEDGLASLGKCCAEPVLNTATGRKKRCKACAICREQEPYCEALRPLSITPAHALSLGEFLPRLDVVRQLVTLRTDAPIPFDEVFAERVIAPPSPEDDHGFSGSFDEPHEEAMPAAEETQPVIEGTIEPAAEDKPAPVQKPAPQASQALTVSNPQGLAPRNLDEAYRLAKAMHISRQFGAYGNPEAVMATILAGHELGLQPMAALRAVHIIEGKPSLSADLIRARALQHPQCRYFRCTARSIVAATFETQRGDDPPVSLTFTIADAKLMWSKGEDAWKKSGWAKSPADMCVARASVKLARLVYPEVTFALYDEDELREQAA